MTKVSHFFVTCVRVVDASAFAVTMLLNKRRAVRLLSAFRLSLGFGFALGVRWSSPALKCASPGLPALERHWEHWDMPEGGQPAAQSFSLPQER